MLPSPPALPLPFTIPPAPPLTTTTTLVTAFLATLLLSPLLTLLFTTLRYKLALRRLSPTSSTNTPSSSKPPTRPPILPYALPYLGSVPSFLTQTPGSFWRHLTRILQSHHPSLTIITVRLAHQTLHVLSSPRAVVALFKARGPDRAVFNRDILRNAMGVKDADLWRMFHCEDGSVSSITRQRQHELDAYHAELNARCLLAREAVEEVYGRFLGLLGEEFARVDEEMEREGEKGGWKTVRLVEWVRHRVFVASTTTFFGSRIRSMVPDLEARYWDFDAGLLARMYGVPRFLSPRAYEAIDVLLPAVEKWVVAGLDHYDGDPPLNVEWEEHMGARVTRERRVMYKKHMGLSTAGMASMDLGFMFGLTSNAIPAICWLLCHLLDPANATLYAKILDELQTAKRPAPSTATAKDKGDGDSHQQQHYKLDLATLLTLPHLNSALNETLRVYVDVLVTRQLKTDMVLAGHALRAGEIVMAPTYLGHHDAGEWNSPSPSAAMMGIGGGHDSGKAEAVPVVVPPEDVWYGERFLRIDETTGEIRMSTRDLAGKYFPFGGGTHMCPGRVFARQEVLGGVAAFLCAFEVSFERWVGGGGAGKQQGDEKEAGGFPRVKRQYAGNGVVHLDGDVEVRIRPRREW